MPSTSKLDAVLSALADPSRRSIVEQLTHGEATVGMVAKPLQMKPPSVSKHIRVLEAAGLVKRRLRGREHWLQLTSTGLHPATEWFAHYSQFWNQSLDRLGDLVDELERATAPEDGR